jgi:hypothetical protein
MYSIEELAFILYNNRSVKGVVENFIPQNIDSDDLIEIEKILVYVRKIFHDQKFVEVEKKDVDFMASDITVKPSDIENLKEKIINASKNISEIEKEYLIKRGIGEKIINQWQIGGLSQIKDCRDLEIINATCHPILRPILEDGIVGGGIIIPLFADNKLVNCAVRKISDIGKLKYALACPDIDVWGLDDINDSEVWIAEGLFDMMALRSIGLKAVSVSSPMWSSIQLYKLLEKKPKSIVIFCDNDSVGLKVGMMLRKFFNIKGITNQTVVSKTSKDAAEHIFQLSLGFEDITRVDISLNLINSYSENFNFLKYLKNKKF